MSSVLVNDNEIIELIDLIAKSKMNEWTKEYLIDKWGAIRLDSYIDTGKKLEKPRYAKIRERITRSKEWT